ncbi:hypothetical protein RF11_13522 [Thelohanellus kitauei]|uniref:Uncharacterized protein n=1 Tax=Thelohanellus kitauei TaxID=669202 RepID=A0A0C2IVM9_THEKT|nr:hypothetical protein RF11_13522 [Thelohanellus kitauei]
MIIEKSLKVKIYTGLTKCLCLLRSGFGLSSVIELPWEESRLDVGQNTTLGNSNTIEKFVQLFVIADCQLNVSGNNTGLLVITGSISSQFKDFSRQIFKNGSHINGGSSTNTFGESTSSEHSMHTTNREL